MALTCIYDFSIIIQSNILWHVCNLEINKGMCIKLFTCTMFTNPKSKILLYKRGLFGGYMYQSLIILKYQAIQFYYENLFLKDKTW